MSRHTRKTTTRSSAKTRKAPTAHASDAPLGKVMEKNGQPWIVEAAGSSKRWNKAPGHFTHDNGSHPFYVKIRNGKLDVLKEVGDHIYSKHVYSLPSYKKVWVGERGSAVFVHISGSKYVYIGDRIVELTLNEPITQFKGIIGNSDVVYSFAVGDNNTYFFPENKYLPNTMFPKSTHDDRYKVFYSQDNWGSGTKIPSKTIVKRVEV
jgi:hypothetical protein